MRLFVLFLCVLLAANSPEARDSDLQLSFPSTPLQPFAPIYDSIKNVECRNHALKFMRDLKEMKYWALKMYDSSGKISSGVLRGNVRWMGDEKECFSVTSNPGGKEGREDEIRGQYCVATIYVKTKISTGTSGNSLHRTIKEIHDVIKLQSVNKSNSSQSRQFYPKFNSMDIGLCIPHTCTPSDLRVALSEWLPGNTSQVLELDTSIEVHDDGCLTEELKMSMKGKLFLCFCALMTFVGIAGYFYDISIEKQMKDGEAFKESGLMMRALLAFSFRRSLRRLMNMGTPMDELSCIHGIRAFFALILFMIHIILFTMLSSIANRDDLAQFMTGPASMVMRAFWGNVDTFVLISGLLHAYYAFKGLEKGHSINIKLMYLKRYLKFTPIFVIMVLWSESIAEHMVTESNYLLYLKKFTDTCKNKWLNVLTYTNALQGMDEMCYASSHQLETDMHMYLILPFIIIFLWKMPKTAIISILMTTASLSYLKYRVMMNEELPTIVYYGIIASSLTKSADIIYVTFIHRLVPYFFGILLAYYLRCRDKKRKPSKVLLLIGSTFALWGAYYTFLSKVHLSRPGCKYDVTEAATYGVLQPYLWSFTISWLIYICASGQAESINRILSWRGFLITSRLAYAFYLSQLGVILAQVGAHSTPMTFTFSIIFDLNLMAKVLLTTIWLTLLFYMPFEGLWNIMKKPLHQSSKNKED